MAGRALVPPWQYWYLHQPFRRPPGRGAANRSRKSVRNVAILGGGSVGTVIANIIARNGYQVLHWMRDNEQVEMLNAKRENAVYLPGLMLDDKVIATVDLEAAVKGADLVFVAVPSGSFRSVVRQLKCHARADAILISLTKGIEAQTFCLMSQILRQECPD